MPIPNQAEVPFAAVGSDPVNLDTLAPQHYPCIFKGKHFVLHEPSEAAKVEYHSRQFRGARMEGDKVHVSMDRAAEAPSLLVSLCLRDVSAVPNHEAYTGDKQSGAPLSQDQVKAFGGRLVKFLDEKAREMGGMSETQDTLEKAFSATAAKLLKLSGDATEKQQWVEWMTVEISRQSDNSTNSGSTEEQAKN